MTKYYKYDFDGEVKWMFLDGVFLVDPAHMAEFRLYHYNSIEVAV